MHFSIYRYNPDVDDKPYMKEYELDKSKLRGVMLLDALEALKEDDQSLSFRRSCGEGVCGSDGMNINGKNGLACITPLKELGDKVTLRPLPGMPVIRDLIVDLTNFYNQYAKVEPFLKNKGPAPAKERLQSPEEREKLDNLYECILCACCTSSCPSYWWNPDKYLGPAALLQATRFIFDSRDDATDERLDKLTDAYSLYRCRGVLNCMSACPKNLKPNEAIGKIKKEHLKKGT